MGSRVPAPSSTWVQHRLVAAGLLKGKKVAVDATLFEANAAMRSIVRRDTAPGIAAKIEFLKGWKFVARAAGA
jgi:hypothetical protein